MRTILLVEDDKDAGNAFRETLQADGYRVEIASDARQAMERLEYAAFDAVVSDLELDGPGGKEVLAWVKGDPRMQQLPVIIHTAFPITAQLRFGLHDAAAVVEKDGRFERVRETLDRLFRGTAERHVPSAAP